MTEQLLIWIPLLPLIAAAIVGLFGKALPRSAAHWLTILGVGAAFILSAIVFKATLAGFTHNADLYTWLVSGDIHFSVGFLIDNLNGDDDGCCYFCFAYGAHLHHRIYARRSRL
jgi:NADH-quinone oxidoreductase subunit L